jgi:hypothetical protein
VFVLTNLATDVFSFASKTSSNYRYLGLRQVSNSITTGSLRDSTVQFLASCLANEDKNSSLRPVLEMLGFEECIVALTRPKTIRDRVNDADAIKLLSTSRGARSVEVDSDRADELLLRLRRFTSTLGQTEAKNESLEITRGLFVEEFSEWQSELLILSEIGRDFEIEFDELIRFVKRAGLANAEIYLRSADGWRDSAFLSAGQLLLLSSIGRLVATLEPDSLVLIDEPETGLHPNWQSDFIPLLKKTFSREFGCHFFMASHSPHLVADASDVLVPGSEWGQFQVFADPYFGRSMENILYRVFNARVTGNSMVDDDLTLLLAVIASGEAPSGRADASAAISRLVRLSNSDTTALNEVLTQTRAILGTD